MFRRRPLRGLGRPNVPPLLRRANRLFADMQYAQAAAAYTELAERAATRFPGRAPFLFVEAGRAAMLAGDAKAGVAHFQRGLTLLAAQGRFQRFQALGNRLMTELNTRGFTSEASEIANLLNDQKAQVAPAQEAAPAKKAILPTHCPSCGGALRPDEVEWLDDATVECSYCGSPVRGE